LAELEPVQIAKDDDLVLEVEDAGGLDAPDGTAAQCQALTKAGKQCRNRPQPGSVFCHIHQE